MVRSQAVQRVRGGQRDLQNTRLVARLSPLAALALAAALATPTFAESLPRLVVLITVEQLRADHLDVYGGGLGRDGLARLMAEGAYFRRCRYETLATWASPSAATVATGAYANRHGIVADFWYDRQSGAVIEAVPTEDPRPELLEGSTLADELMLSMRHRARVVAVSDDPAPAVLMAGRRPAGCYWRNEAGRFTSTPRYSTRLPEWVTRFDRGYEPLRPERKAWKALEAESDAPPLRSIEGPQALEYFLASPFAIEDLFTFARTAVENESLGRRNVTDLLILNVGAPARLALETGAYSPLMRDLVLRFDRTLGDFLRWIDLQVGLEDTLVVLTALHGIPPQLSDLRRRRLPNGRVRGETVAQAMQTGLSQRYGPALILEKYLYPSAYLGPALRRLPGPEHRAALAAAGEAARGVPGVARYFFPEEPEAGGAFEQAFRHAAYPGRSGDLLVAYDPYFVEEYSDGRGVASGSFYRYDTDVPLIFYGRRFRPGVYESAVDATSIAPTLAAALAVALPNLAQGSVLNQALLPSGTPDVGPPEPALE